MKGQAKMLFNKKDFDSKQRFSIRKLSVGVCSVLLSTLFLTFNEGQTVHASTNVNAADTTTTSVSSNTTNNSSDNNTDKKDDSKVEASSLATAEKHAPIPIAAEIKSNKSEDQTNSASAETDTQVSKSKQAQNQTTTNIVKATDTQAATSSKDSSDTTSSKDNSAQNTVEKNRSTSTSKYTPVLTSETSVSTKANQSNSNSATQEKSNIKPVTPHADSTEHIAPETYTMDSDSPAYVIAGSDLTNLASKFISNADALTQSGATFSWDGNVPTATQQDAMDGNTISGTIRVTYKDGTSTTIDINSYVEARSTLQPSTFYYVNRVNDTPDFNTADANGNNFSTMIVNQYAFDSTAFSYKILGTLDTSSLGIHWANVQVMDNNTFAGAPLAPKVIGDPYVIKVPYVVQGLKLRDDIPTDANGNPVINAQLATMPKSTSTTPTTPEVAFDPAQGNSTTNVPSGLWGQYFYQDYALAYALGIKVQVAEDDLDNNGKWKNKPTDLVNTKTNHFAITFNNLPNATQQEVDVNYVSAPHAEDMYNQQIKVYVTVIPKTTAVDGQNFFTNGEKYDGTTGSIANGNNQGAILTQANGQAIDYTTYSGQKTPGEQTVYDTKTTSYTPTYSLSGLETNSDGSLDSGVQTATVRVSVPKGTIGAKVDADGTYYYEVNAKVNIAQKVNFEFVDEYNDNNVVGQTYSQEFIPGVATNLNFNMAMPDGYELGNGASIPSQYTLAAFSQTTPVVKVPIHQKMHFYITVHDEDSNTNLGTVEVSGSTAGNGGGWYPNINTKLTFPAGADAGDYYSVSTSGVPDGVQLVGSYGVSLTNPTADWTNPNYKWDNNTFSVLKALTGATMTINLKHKIQETQEQQTRKPTVNYIKAKVNADGTYTPDGSAFTSAVLDVYYSRTKSKDLVTKKVTYTPWLWDTKQGQNGYHVESGTWTYLPQSWGAVVADVPTLDGYTAATVTDQSGQPANQFVYPTWNKAGTSDEGKESLAYTENAPIYEARPVHTVLYVPNEQQARTITSKYVIAGGNKNGQQFAPDSQIQIFYDRTGTLNVANNTITYGNWQWDNTAGDRATPGFHVISGSWSLPTDKTSSWQVNIPNSGNDYVVANLRYDGAYSTFTLAAPSYNANDVFTSPTSDQWFTRNILVTYYVPTSMVNKTVTRTIKISEPGQDSKTITQTVKLTRQVRVNQDDTGVVYDGFAGSGWSTGNWAAQDVPTHGGYTMYATQTVNGVTTPIQLVNGQIPAEPVNGTSQDTTINITWGAVAKATLTGTGTSTYNGQAITNAELNNALKVNVTGPTAGAGTYTLQAGDVEFSIDGTNWTTALPINAGNYQVRLTAQGKNGIIGKYGNNSIIWTQNGQSTITSNATYMINKLADNAVMANAQSGNYEMTYNGAAPSTIDPSKFVFTTTVNGQTVTLDATGLNSSDFTWADGNAPVNVGTYKVVLTDAGLAKLNANNPNFDLTNSGNGTFTINQANASATLSGSASREYNGQAVSVDDLNSTSTGNNITLTLHYPKDGNANYSTTVKLNNGYFTWNTPNGQAPVNADSQPYTIVLNSDAIEGIIKQAVGNGQNDVSNVKFASDAISGSANYTITPLVTSAKLSNITEGNYTKVYDAQATNQIDASKLHITVNLGGQKVDLDTTGLTGSDYQWVDASGTALTSNPKNVGTYYIKLSDTAFAKLQAQNPNFKLTNTGLGVYTITQANASGELTGSNSKVYNGSAISLNELNSNGSIKVTLNFPGVNGQTYTLKSGDYTISGNATDAGEYTVTLTDAGKTNVENYIKSLAGTGQGDESNVKFADNAISGSASFEITPSANTVSVSGTQTETYNGSPINVVYNADDTNSVKVSITQTSGNTTGAVASLADVTLDSGDFAIVNGPAENVGSYQVKLTAAGLAKIQNAVGDNYSLSLADTTGTLVINKAKASAVFSGNSSMIYNGSAVSTADLYANGSTIKVAINGTGIANLPKSFTLEDGDYTWSTSDNQSPVNVGNYTIKLTQAGINKIQSQIDQVVGAGNVVLTTTTDDGGSASFEIKQAVAANVQLYGGENTIYNGNPVSFDPTKTETANNFGFHNVENLTVPTFTASDFTWYDGQGNKLSSAPTNAGTYYISLTANGLKKLQADNPNYAISESGQFTYVISPAEENVTISGSQESTSTSIDNANFTVHAPAGITVPTGMTYEFATGVPSESGVYVIKLTPESIAALEKTNPNYKLNISSDARFTLDATLSIEFEDTQDGNKQVGKTITKTGVANSTINDLKLVVPDNYELAPDQELPTSYTFGKTLNQNLYIKLVHKLNELNPTDPSTNPDPTNKNWFRENGLVKDVTRTINYEGLSTAQLAQIPETQKAQTVEFTRTAKYDLVTGKIVVNSEGSWTAVDGKDIFAGFTPFAFAGYTAAPAKVEQVKVTGNDKNSQITVTYTANNQTGKISYVDSQGNEVGQTALTGKTDQSVAVTPEAPTGWIIVAGQDIPKSVTATATGIPTVTVKVEHSTTIVTPETPEKDIPTGPVPGDPSKNYEKMESLTASPTRTIVVTDPSGKTTKVTQTVNFTRMATFDEVTGEITYSNWASSEPTEWSQYAAPEVAGYTATQMVKSQVVSAETADETIRISYTANTQAGKISYVDSDGKEVGQTALTGKTDQSVVVTPEAPAGWRIVPGQDIPKSVTATATGIPTVTVKVEHSTIIVTPETPEKDIPTGPVPGDPSKNYEKMESLTASPTRTIVVTDPSGKTTEVTQAVNFTRTATFDEVTGKVTYSDWKLQNSNASNHAAQWDSYTPHVITHYVPSVAEVPAKVVNAHTANSQVEITYAPASESQVIRYVDQNGKEISTQIVSGKYGLDTTFTPKLPNNWQAANTIPTSIKIGENGGLTTIVIEAKTEKVQQSKTVTETIHYHTANGKQIVADKEMKVNFTRTGVKNLVTGEITWNSWNNAEEIFNEVPSPKVSGYTASPAKVAAQTVTPNSEDLVFNVIYTKNSQTYPTIPENKPNKPQEENVSKQETKTQDKLIHEYGYKKRADGRLVDHTGHVYPASSKVKENGAIYSEKGELLSVGSRRKHELPQTGLHDNSLIAAIGSLLAGISIFGLLGGRKKKDDDK